MGLNCAPKTVTKIEYRDVMVPVRCNVVVPPKPERNPDRVLDISYVYEYADKLERLLRVCVEGK